MTTRKKEASQCNAGCGPEVDANYEDGDFNEDHDDEHALYGYESLL